jgi:hypothetical protein
MSDRNPFHNGGKETAPWDMDFETESYPCNDSAEMNIEFFRDIMNSDELPNTHQVVLSPNPTTTTATPGTPGNCEPTQPTTTATLVDDDAESTQALGSIKEEDEEKPQRVKKRRRSRNSPEPDYSQMILELNKKRKRTGQACDRCRVCRSTYSRIPHVLDTLTIMLSYRYADTNATQTATAVSIAEPLA